MPSSKHSSARSSPPRQSSPKSNGTTSASKRLLREISDYNESPNSVLLHLGPVSDTDLFHWEAVLKGVRGSAYDGGLWLLDITVGEKYPLEPPKIMFKTPICHPNVHFSSGEICLTLLTNKHWTPMYTLSSTMTAIHQLLTDPEPESPLNVDIANLMRDQDQVGADGLIRFWTAEKRWTGEGEGGWISERWRGSGGKLGG
ncbi:MAG: hypothetical protein Q9160_006596 [Pyrenula sp. 1 TL-2023]